MEKMGANNDKPPESDQLLLLFLQHLSGLKSFEIQSLTASEGSGKDMETGLESLETQALTTIVEFEGQGVKAEQPKTLLETFPVEILQSITFYLPDQSEACLALSSKTLQQKLGHGSFIRMKESNTANISLTFLVLLSRDLPNLQVCNQCCILHPGIAVKRKSGSPPSIHRPGKSGKSKKLTCTFRSFDGSNLGLRSALVKKFMDKTSLPYRGIAWRCWLLHLNWHQLFDGFHFIETWYKSDNTHQKHYHFRRINNNMFERTQRSVLFPWIRTDNAVFSTHHVSNWIGMKFWVPCCHKFQSFQGHMKIWEEVNCRTRVIFKGDYGQYPHESHTCAKKPCVNHPADALYRCLVCATEYQVGTHREEEGLIITLTSWRIVSHCFAPLNRPTNPTNRPAERVEIPQDESSLKGSFEGLGNSWKSQDCATELSRALLLEKVVIEEGKNLATSREMEFDGGEETGKA